MRGVSHFCYNSVKEWVQWWKNCWNREVTQDPLSLGHFNKFCLIRYGGEPKWGEEGSSELTGGKASNHKGLGWEPKDSGVSRKYLNSRLVMMKPF